MFYNIPHTVSLSRASPRARPPRPRVSCVCVCVCVTCGVWCDACVCVVSCVLCVAIAMWRSRVLCEFQPAYLFLS